MIVRTLNKTVVSTRPFLLKGVDRLLPAGDYRVVTDEELIEGLSFPGLPSNFDPDLRTSAISTSIVG
jgi:cephalosporin hydroxylase